MSDYLELNGRWMLVTGGAQRKIGKWENGVSQQILTASALARKWRARPTEFRSSRRVLLTIHDRGNHDDGPATSLIQILEETCERIGCRFFS